MPPLRVINAQMRLTTPLISVCSYRPLLNGPLPAVIAPRMFSSPGSERFDNPFASYSDEEAMDQDQAMISEMHQPKNLIEEETRRTISKLLKEVQLALGSNDELAEVRDRFQLDSIENDFMRLPVKDWKLVDPQPPTVSQLEERRLREIEKHMEDESFRLELPIAELST